MKNRYRIPAALIACCISLSAWAAVTASVEKSRVASGETVQLLLQRDGSTGSQPDLGPLKRDFDILGSSSGSKVQIINGHMSSLSQVNILLAPKHDGKIQIPPLEWDGQQSAALELTVGGSGGATREGAEAASDTSQHVFLTSTLDQKQPYVQAAVVLTVRLYTDQTLYKASLDLPASANLLVKQLGKDRQMDEVRNGRSYHVVERKYLLFPQRSGKLSLDGPVLNAQVQDTGSNNPMFGNLFSQTPFGGIMDTTRPLRLHAKPVELNVLPRPDSADGANWLPAQKVTLEETWRPDVTQIHVGEPLTRHLHLEALGLTGEQLPELNTIMSVPDGIKAYPDRSIAADSPQGETVLGRRDQDIALIAMRPGHYELPAIRIGWWDTQNNTRHEAMLPARSLDILPALAGSTGAAIPPPAKQETLIQAGSAAQASPIEQSIKIANTQTWKWISLALGLLWVGTAAAWWHERQRVQHAQPAILVAENQPGNVQAASIQAASAFKAFKRACSDNDPHAARQQLLAWASTVWPADKPSGLNALSRRLDDTKLTQALRQLDRACYTGSAWHGEDLALSLPAPLAQTTSQENKNTLPELYP